MSARPSLLFVNQHYYPDIASTGQHLTDLAEFLAESGFEVTVMCGEARYLGGGQAASLAHEVRNGVEIVRVPMTSFGRARAVGRIADYASFYASMLARLLRGKRYDLLVTLTTPPLLSAAAALVRRIRGQRYGVWSMDLHPDAEEAIGMIRSGSLIARTLHAANTIGYRRADLVVDLGPYMKARLLAKGVLPERAVTIPVWSRRDEIVPVNHADNPIRAELGLGDRFVVMYSGNAGLAHRFEEVCEVMRRLRDDDRFFFLFVGSGPRRAEIEAFAAREKLEHFRYLDYVTREQLRYSLPLGDVHLVTLRDQMGGIAVPGKVYGIMAAERPIVMVGPRACEPAEAVLRHEVGVHIDTTDGQGADALESALRALEAHPDMRIRMGSRAREVFLATYERDVCCEEWAETLGRVVNKTGD